MTASLVCVFAAPLLAQHLPIKTYTVADGLPQNSINKITQEATGFFWFCTEGGLARFDGYNFTNFTVSEGLPSDKIKDFLVTRDGDYWLATTGGLVKFTPDGTIYARVITIDEASQLAEAPVFVTYPLPNTRIKTVTKLLEDRRGTIWVGANDGLFRLEKSGGGFNLIPFELGLSSDSSERYIYSLYQDRSDAIWVGTENSLIRISADERVTGYAANESSPVYFRALLEDRDGNFWVGTLKKGLFQFGVDENGTPQPIRHLTPKGDSEISWIETITESFDGRMWLGTSGGLFEFDAATSKFYRYTRQSGIGDNRYQSMFEDKSRNLWLGTRANGVFRLARRGLVSFGLEDDIAFVRSVSGGNDGNLLITGFLNNAPVEKKGAKIEVDGNGKVFEHFLWRIGRFHKDGLKWLRPALPEAIDYFGSGENQTNFQARNGEWWIATGKGLFRFPKVDFDKLPTTQPITILDKKSGLAPQDIFRLYEDERGDVWISTGDETGRGFFLWKRETETLSDIGNMQGLPTGSKDSISAFAEDRAGNLWIGFLNRGLARISGGKARFFDLADGVSQGGANGFFVDREGRLWVASGREGVMRIDEPASENPRVITIGKNEGLSSNLTFAVTQDLQGLIYIATDRDINRLNPATGEIKVLKVSSNQPQREFRSAFCDVEGVLWFGTTSGLVKYAPLPEGAKRPPEVLLTSVEIEGKPQKVSLLGAVELTLRDLAPDENQVRIDFISLAALDDEAIRYQYKVESQSDWSSPAPERFVNFAGLASGDYKILLRAVTGDGVTSEKPTLVSFNILSPVYLRWWFVLGVLALATSLIYAFYRFRLTRLLEVERVRTRIATDLHDDIGANLTKIAILSEVAQQQLGHKMGANGNGKENLLGSVAEISRESVSAMGDIVWAINPKKDSLIGLTRRMRQYAEEILERREINLEFNAPAPARDLKLDANIRRNVYLIFKETVNNILRHSKASTVKIDFALADNELVLQIDDDGGGFDQAREYDGNGLSSIKKRAEDCGGRLEINSVEGAGTKILLRLKLKSAAWSRR
ncbi:MAG: two-component regulator propeller domain-containing protein [Pyrinomonadaceae bacterium]